MAGQGISYPPPTEDVPIFDSSLFNANNAPLTIDEGKKYFLQYPNAQGTENLKITNVGGLLTANAGLTITAGDLNNENNIILNGIPLTNYIQFPDGTKQYTASTGGGGGGGLIQPPTYIQSSFTAVVSGSITPPVGTRLMKIIVIGPGGTQGPDSLVGDTMTAGGTGAGGAFIEINMDVSNWANTRTGIPILNYSNYDSLGVSLQWSTAAYNQYGASGLPYTVFDSFNNIYFFVSTGTANGSSSSAGATLGGTYSVPSANTVAVITATQGGVGKATAPFTFSTANITSSPGSNINADITYDNSIIAPYALGGYSSYVNGGITAYPPGPGGYAFYFYS